MTEERATPIGPAEAARILQVDESRIDVLVEEGLLHPVDTVDPVDTSHRFDPAEVRAVRLQGG